MMATKENVLFIVLLCVAFVSSIEAKLRDGDGISIIPRPDETIFDVTKYGAVPDGETDNQEAFMDTWRAACKEHIGKARFLVPQGDFAISSMLFAGPCTAASPIVFQFTGNLKAVTDVSLYDEPRWVTFENLNGVVILGGGTFDGQGQKLWKYNDCKTNPSCVRLPASVVINKCTNVSIRRIKSLNAMGFHFYISQSNNVRLQRLKITTPDESPNTDGIHISESNNVRVTRSSIESGDDCIGILQGSTRLSISKVTCGPGHGISVGSLGKHEDEQDVRGIQVKNCTLRGTTNGLRIKTYPFKPNVVPIRASGFLFKDIIMENVKNPIIIDQEYCGRGKSCVTAPSKISLSDIFFINIMGTSVSEESIMVKCSSAVPCQNVHFHNVNLVGVPGIAPISTCTNARVSLSGLQFPPMKC